MCTEYQIGTRSCDMLRNRSSLFLCCALESSVVSFKIGGTSPVGTALHGSHCRKPNMRVRSGWLDGCTTRILSRRHLELKPKIMQLILMDSQKAKSARGKTNMRCHRVTGEESKTMEPQNA